MGGANRIPDDVRGRIVRLALDEPALSPRELAVRFTDTVGYFVSEASVYRLLKAHSRAPIRFSKSRIMWLSVDGDTPSSSAAFRKLRCLPTARKAESSVRVGRCIAGLTTLAQPGIPSCFVPPKLSAASFQRCSCHVRRTFQRTRYIHVIMRLAAQSWDVPERITAATRPCSI